MRASPALHFVTLPTPASPSPSFYYSLSLSLSPFVPRMYLSTCRKVLVGCVLRTENAFEKCVKKKKACGCLNEEEGIGGGGRNQFEALCISSRGGNFHIPLMGYEF